MKHTLMGPCHHLLLFGAVALLLCSCRELPPGNQSAPPPLTDHQIAVLNALRDEINLTYGFENGWPRVDRGPCGRFAKLFYEQWNARFCHKINIAFIMHPDNANCEHVLVRLPDGSFYDGGNGVISGPTLLREFKPDEKIVVMEKYDFKRLDLMSYGLGRSYQLCPNFSDEVTSKIIGKYLDQLPRD